MKKVYRDQSFNHYFLKIEVPKECPICNVRSHIGGHIETFNENEIKNEYDVIYSCSNADCLRRFLGIVVLKEKNPPSPETKKRNKNIIEELVFDLIECYPKRIVKKVFPEFIYKISKNFVEIYNEAEIAEVYGLKKISGPGFRKAFEFLLKDYAIERNPNDKEKIENMFVSNVIRKYFSETEVREMSDRAIWIGNDETHYVRRWDGKDLTDLKNLISITISWMNLMLQTEDYKKNMPPIKKN